MAEEVQINANDLLDALGTEVAALTQRAVVAELQVKSLRRALKETQAEVDEVKGPTPDGEARSQTLGSPVP